MRIQRNYRVVTVTLITMKGTVETKGRPETEVSRENHHQPDDGVSSEVQPDVCAVKQTKDENPAKLYDSPCFLHVTQTSDLI